MVGIVGYTKFKILPNEKQIKEMAENIKTNANQSIVYFSNELVDVALIAYTELNSCRNAVNEDGRINVFVYGKIYGYPKDLEMLKIMGHKFQDDRNVAEFVCHAYEEYGEDAFCNLNGSFCLVISNMNSREVVIVTDKFGTRPIYYAFQNGELIFSSHSRAILHYPSFLKELNEKTLVKFLMFGKIGILGDETWFKGIKLMPPASILKFDGVNLIIKKYWDLEYHSELKEREAVDLLTKRFVKAVNVRADSVSEGLCLMLSGGLDSRSVLAALSTRNLQKVTAVTFGTKNCDDIIIAKMIAKKLGVKHLVIEYDPDELVKYAKDVVYLTEGQDTVNVAFIPYVAEKLRKMGFKYFLQGYMFDLLLGGSFLSKEIFNAKTFSDLATILATKYMLFSLKEIKNLLNAQLQKYISSVLDEFYKLIENSRGDSFANLSDYFAITTRVRRYTLMGSILNRYFLEELLPTIDKDVIDIIRRIPPELRFNHYLYRKFLINLNSDLSKIPYQKTLIPPIFPHMLWRLTSLLLMLNRIAKGKLAKHTFFDFDEILRTSNNWRKLVTETLLNDESLAYKRGYLNKEFVKRLVSVHYSGKNCGEKLAFLITFELFLRIFFQNE
jgi:asparagine synthase (glutamine-hydrolysing)